MQVINIFLTDDLGETLEDFVHDDRRFTFGKLGPEGPKQLVEGPVWAFIDWVLDDIAGLEMCRRLRADQRTSDAHVTMVLESDDIEDRRRALKAGADDYIVGPLDRTAVLDRVLALQADHQPLHSAQRLEFGPLVIDMAALQARWAGEPIHLRPNEFRLLRFFAENRNRVLSFAVPSPKKMGRPEAALRVDGPRNFSRDTFVVLSRIRSKPTARSSGRPSSC